jgi:hypothetical protein
MPLQETSGTASYDAFGGGVAVVPNYIEDVFSTYLYTGTGATQTITNGIDLSTKGGLVWIKDRTNVQYNWLMDTVRGTGSAVISDLPNARQVTSTSITAFNSNGFTLGSSGYVNFSASDIVSWTFRKQPKFFDVVTYTGTGSNTTISHNLGSVPGSIIVKRTDTAADWAVYHQSLANTQYLVLDTIAAAATGATWWNSTTPTSSVFSVGTDASVNASGGTYVAYLFAHNAGGFGLTGTDNVISCGSFTTDASGNATVNLGYEPQWVVIKPTTATGNAFIDNWLIYDSMRGWPTSGTEALLKANTNEAEIVTGAKAYLTATGLNYVAGVASIPFIYIAIRRGPMKVPTDATKVFSPNAVNVGQGTQITTNFPVGMVLASYRLGGGSGGFVAEDRLRGFSLVPNDATTEPYLYTYSNSAEATGIGFTYAWNNTGFLMNGAWASLSDIFYSFQRAPSFFDEACQSMATNTFSHNLAAVPELIIYRSRTSLANWVVYAPGLYAGYMNLNETIAVSSVYKASATSTTVTLINTYTSNPSVAYLFATCAGVSKVGSYTGNGTTQAIACGFTGGARFVLIKQTDAVGGWYVYDTARGMTTLTDPYLFLNSTAAEAATLGSVTTTTGGFTVNAAILAAINTSAATYIFLAIA